MERIAVTGGIACGKSVVGSFLAVEGIAVCEADSLAHELMGSAHPAYAEIVKAFGEKILGNDGAIDREALGKLVFSNKKDLAKLNAIVHPRVKKAWEQWLKDMEERHAAAVIVPLLYEANEGRGWDAVICVSASEPVQLRRLVARGLSEHDARKRIAAQMAMDRKASFADYVINNVGGKDLLKKQTVRVLRSIMEK